MNHRKRHWLISTALSAVILAAGGLADPASAAASQQVRTYQFDFKPQPLADALRQVARQSGLSLLIDARLTAGRQAAGLRGTMTAPEAMRRLLAGSGLQLNQVDEGVATIQKVSAPLALAPAAQSDRDKTFSAPAAPPQAMSAEPAGPGELRLEEIVVTARRKEENLMTVPLAVAVMSAATIDNAGVRSVRELAQFTPGMFSQTQDAGGLPSRVNTRLTFRGLSTASGMSFIDGAPYAGAGTPDVSDVARVEALKGPQSVYFGRSTFSGAINYVTKQPANEFAGRVSADVYSYDGLDARLSLEGPIIPDLLRARINVRRYSFGGQYRNGADHQRLGGQSTTSATVAIASKPSANLDLSAYYAYSLDDDGPPAGARIRVVGPGPTLTCNLGGNGGPYWCGELPKLKDLDSRQFGSYAILDPFTRSELIDNARGVPTPFSGDWIDHFGLKRRIHHVHARADYHLPGGWEAALLGGLSDTKTAVLQGREGANDTSGTPNPLYLTDDAARAAACAAPAGSTQNQACFRPKTLQLSTYQQNIVRDYNAELRISTPSDQRLRATAGASYFAIRGPISTNFGIQNGGRLLGTGLVEKVSTPAVFGGVYFDVTRDLKVSFEGRYQWDAITRQQLFPTQTDRLYKVFKSFSPRVTADYNLSARSMVYATWSRGYRPGGFNPALLGLAQSALDQLAAFRTNIAYDQEELDNFEVGHKAQWFDNRLRTTLALYYMKYKNGQVTNQNTVRLPTGGTLNLTIISNVGQIDLKGLELEVDFAATRHLSITGSLGYADNKIISYVYTPHGLRIRGSTNVDGNQTEQQPKLTLALSPTYRRHIRGDWQGFARLDYFYRSRLYTDPTNVAWRGAASLVNARIGLTSGGGIRIEGYVNNLFDNGTLSEASKANDGSIAPNPAVTCPPCFTAAAPPITSQGVSDLNAIGVGLPIRRTFGMRIGYDF